VLRIPPNLAYGARGVSTELKDVVPPNAHLEFDVELKSIAANPLEEAFLLAGPQRIGIFLFSVLLLAIAPLLG